MLFNTNTDQSKERVKAGFSVLDHFVKIYNSSETYIKRGLTLFGLGSILAGATFGGGQQLPSSQQNTSVERSPSIIYVQVPAQSTAVPVKVQPPTNVPQPVASQKILSTKPASVQRKTATPVRVKSAAKRTMVNLKPISTPTQVRPQARVPQRVTAKKIVRAKSAPAPTKAKMPVRPVSRPTRKIAPSVIINASTPKQVRSAIAQATRTTAQVKPVVAPLKLNNNNF
ncbi:MAG: hypothetical protein MUD14_28285 [Hydrococcus sp. Prado102]|jgi:hypothetical protein|nr:hypothetical protein [Hydrococcus sp. Prado102]